MRKGNRKILLKTVFFITRQNIQENISILNNSQYFQSIICIHQYCLANNYLIKFNMIEKICRFLYLIIMCVCMCLSACVCQITRFVFKQTITTLLKNTNPRKHINQSSKKKNTHREKTSAILKFIKW